MVPSLLGHVQVYYLALAAPAMPKMSVAETPEKARAGKSPERELR